MREVTGQEHVTPVKIKSVSATERAAFRKCRRQWFLATVQRVQTMEGNQNYWLGTLVHRGLEVYYRWRLENPTVGPRDPAMAQAATAALEAYEAAYTESLKPFEEFLEFLWPRVEPTYRELGELGFDMLAGYFASEVENPIFEEIVEVERRLFVPIRNPRNGRKAGTLTVQTDLVGRNGGRLGVADHKTAAREMSSAQLDLDDQLSAEAFAVWLSRGEFPDDVIYNVLLKKAPRPPKQLKPGKNGKIKLSKDMSQGATYALYVDEIRRLGLEVGDYADVLLALREQERSGESQFFRRETTFRTPAQMAAFEANLFYEWKDMAAVALHPERAYPNPSPFNCPSCPVRLICTTIQDDGDVEAILKATYMIADPRR